MQIQLHEITVRELCSGYTDNNEGGVRGLDGHLDIRPPYQREFVYKDKQREAVIETVFRGFPLNVMYWAVRSDNTETPYEVIDGQQRTISICQYVMGDFSTRLGDFPHPRAFHNLQDDERERILNYRLMVYLCSGTDAERLSWFKTINIAGERLTEQELRNAVFAGSWVSDAKRYFSRMGCPAQGLASDLLSGSAIRQEYFETAIRWISEDQIEEYMSRHQHDANASALWIYFQSVISWVRALFPKKRREMKGVDWGSLYNHFKEKVFDAAQLEAETARLLMDDDVTNKKGIYPYLLTYDEHHLSIRTFTPAQKAAAYEACGGRCANPKCPHKDRIFELAEMEADHITPWHAGGKTISENCQMLCRDCNRRKSGK